MNETSVTMKPLLITPQIEKVMRRSLRSTQITTVKGAPRSNATCTEWNFRVQWRISMNGERKSFSIETFFLIYSASHVMEAAEDVACAEQLGSG